MPIDCKYTIAAVPPELVEFMWPKVLPHLDRVIEKAPHDITRESVKMRMLAGDTLLVIISDGDEIIAINTLEVRVMDSGVRALYAPIIGGGDLYEWMAQFMDVAMAIGRDFKCTEMRGLAARKGWLSRLQQCDSGWENVHMVVRYPIKDEE